MATVRISGNLRNVNVKEWYGEPKVDDQGRIERSLPIPEEAYQAIERQIAKGGMEGIAFLADGRQCNWLLDRPITTKPGKHPEAAPPSVHGPFIALDTNRLPWDERFNDKIGKPLYRKELFSDPDTGMLIRLVRYPAGVINPSHTHPCGHGMYVLEGTLVTHTGRYGPGSFVWFPEGEVMEHGASADGDVTVVFITNKPFRIDYTR